MDKKIGIIAVIALVAVVIIAMVFLLPGGGTEETTMTFNGVDYTWDELEAEFGTENVDGNTGIPLGDIIEASNFGDLPSDDQNKTLFRVMADDGWQKNVSWIDLQSGILIEEDRMTYFPDLPSAYKVSNLISVEDVPLGPLAIIQANSNWGASAEITWDELFDELNETTIQGNTGVALTDVLEYAGFTDLENATFTIEGVDGYAKSVNWTSIQTGILIEDKYESSFPDLTGAYKVKNIIRITVE